MIIVQEKEGGIYKHLLVQKKGCSRTKWYHCKIFSTSKCSVSCTATAGCRHCVVPFQRRHGIVLDWRRQVLSDLLRLESTTCHIRVVKDVVVVNRGNAVFD